MNIKLFKSKLQGEISSPPSKSYSHRYLIAAMLSNKKSIISNVVISDDVFASLNCLKAYGCDYVLNNNKIIINPSNKMTNCPIFDCKDSASTLRFFIPIVLTKYKKAKFIMSDRLFNRGIDVYKQTLKNIDFTVEKNTIIIQGEVTQDIYEVDCSISSQYVSGLLFALPLLKQDSTIVLKNNISSKNYIDMTLKVLSEYQIKYDFIGNIIKIYGNQTYISKDIIIEGDYSNAALFEAFNYFENNCVTIKNLNQNSLQGDMVYKDLFSKLNHSNCIIDVNNCIDLSPILFVFATLKHGATFINTSRLKQKESDRILACKNELLKIGADIVVEDNCVIVNKANIYHSSVAFNSCNDHRIIMALTLLVSQFDIQINDAEYINKSYPNFFKDLKSLGLNIKECD